MNSAIEETLKLALLALEPDVHRSEWAVEDDKQKAIASIKNWLKPVVPRIAVLQDKNTNAIKLHPAGAFYFREDFHCLGFIEVTK